MRSTVSVGDGRSPLALALPNMRSMLHLVLLILLTGCGKWEPHGLYDASEVMTTNNVLLFSTGRVTQFFPDRHPQWLGLYENTNWLQLPNTTNGVWVWHLFANHWRIEPDGNSLLCIELGDPKNPLLRNPTNRFHLKPLTSVPKGYRTE